MEDGGFEWEMLGGLREGMGEGIGKDEGRRVIGG